MQEPGPHPIVQRPASLDEGAPAGEDRAKVVTNLSQAEAELVLEDTVDPDAHLMSDEWKVFVAAGAGFRAHETVRHSER